MDILQSTIEEARRRLQQDLQDPLDRIAQRLPKEWSNREALSQVLQESIRELPQCTFVYALNTGGIQISDNVSHAGLLPEHFGRDRSQRPYLKEVVPADGFLLSEAYISLLGRRPSLTALQLIRDADGTVLGFLGADFDLRNLPTTGNLYEEPTEWRQIKGDPSIRGTVFLQTRTESLMDRDMDGVLSVLEELFTERGVFQCVLHFSSSRATVWTLEDPYRYRILTHEALSDPDTCLAFPRMPYPDNAVLPAEAVPRILENLKHLRFADETVYLRSSSINLFNGMISLTFSCDGSHYMTWKDFLDRSMDFWLGSAG
ncbi:MAG: PDC sensor domain-containing protein [Thioalkalivibrio sp.]|nr:PDC sensor domain-containing protein [Thioalkalivibrio sp.]